MGMQTVYPCSECGEYIETRFVFWVARLPYCEGCGEDAETDGPIADFEADGYDSDMED